MLPYAAWVQEEFAVQMLATRAQKSAARKPPILESVVCRTGLQELYLRSFAADKRTTQCCHAAATVRISFICNYLGL